MPESNTFISPAELASQLAGSDLNVVDASWYLPADGRDPRAEFLSSRVPGAQFFDIDTVADLEHACPHMLPSEPVFTQCVQALGIGANSRVVVYDGKGLFSAARAFVSNAMPHATARPRGASDAGSSPRHPRRHRDRRQRRGGVAVRAAPTPAKMCGGCPSRGSQ